MHKINELIKLDKQLYHTADLANIWGTTNQNTLYTTIKRYVKRGILIPIYKGFYSTIPLNQIDPLVLGASAINSFAYLSTESVLFSAGIISQSPQAHTFLSRRNKAIFIPPYTFHYRQLADKYLHNRTGIVRINDHYEASVSRAVADMLYFRPGYYFDLHESIDWVEVKEIQLALGYL